MVSNTVSASVEVSASRRFNRSFTFHLPALPKVSISLSLVTKLIYPPPLQRLLKLTIFVHFVPSALLKALSQSASPRVSIIPFPSTPPSKNDCRRAKTLKSPQLHSQDRGVKAALIVVKSVRARVLQREPVLHLEPSSQQTS